MSFEPVPWRDKIFFHNHTINDDESRLRFRDVSVFRRADEKVFISAGLQRGELVCISPLQSTADGMRVRLASEPGAALAGGAPAGDYGT